MAKKFVYRERSKESYEARANQKAGGYDHYIKDEYRLYTPTKGENCVRILPPSSLWENPPHYGLDVYVHFSVGPDGGSVICLDKGAPQIGRSGQPCPICDEHKRAQRARDNDLARELRPVRRVVTLVIDRKDEAKGPLVWGMPSTVDTMINKASRNRTVGGWYLIDRPEDGWDIYFYREGEDLHTQYTNASRADQPSPVADRFVEWADDNPIPECLNWRDADEIRRIFEGRGRGEGELDESERYRPGRRRDDDDEEDERDRRTRDSRDSRRHRDDERPSRDDRRTRERDRDERPPRDDRDRDDRPMRATREQVSEERRRDERGRRNDDEDAPRGRRSAEEDDPDLTRPAPREEVEEAARRQRRPTSSAAEAGNGRDSNPAPSAKGGARADELREQLQKSFMDQRK